MRLIASLLTKIIVIRALLASRDASPRSSGTSRTDVEVDNPAADARTGAEQDGAGADSPLDIDAPGWKATIKRALKEVKDDRITLIAAGMAYYMFLAIFPAFIALVGILGLIDAPDAIMSLSSSISTTLPGGAGELLVEPIQNAANPPEGASLTAAIVGVAVALWSATSGFVALQSGLNIAYDIGEDRKFIGKRAVALVLILLTALLGGVPSPIFTFGERTVFVVLGWVLTVVAVIVLFSSYYAIGPKRETRGWKWVTPGGLLGAAIWILASLGFGFYVDNFASYGRTYGSLAGVIVLILWLYLSSLAILIGGELNAEIEAQTNKR